MTNEELLLAISDLLDVKLKAELQPLKNELYAEIQSLRDEMHTEIQRLEAQIRQLQLNQEYVIMPALNDIVSCYSDTFKRYRDYGDKMDSVCGNMDLLKKVVMDHSEKLQKLA